MKFALFYEIPVARPWTKGKEHQAFQNVLEQAVLGDQVGFHSRVDGGAPLPRGVLALLEPRGAVRRDRGAHEADPHRLRRAARPEALQPPGALGRERGRARPALRRPRRVRHRPLEHAHRDGGLRPASEPDARDVARGGGPHRHLLERGRGGVLGQALAAAEAPRAAEAAPVAASAGVGRDGQHRRPPHDGRARARPALVQRGHAARGAEAARGRLPRRASRRASSRSAAS